LSVGETKVRQARGLLSFVFGCLGKGPTQSIDRLGVTLEIIGWRAIESRFLAAKFDFRGELE
jgi:hypothetical protein